MALPRFPRFTACCLAAGLLLTSARHARASVPAAYTGKPFDPAVAGGAGIIPAGVKAGPYVIPGRLDFENYDMGPEGVTYSQNHHETKNGAGYRTDVPTATFSLTAQSKSDVWFQTGTAMDGMAYPSATTSDFYVSALDANDWFDYTVDVQTAGTYALSSTWATGNGPPGGEGGDGTLGLEVSVNGTTSASWNASFPDFATTASYHNWKPYPAFATLTLEAGLQLLTFKCTANHLNLDYVEFALVSAGGSGGAGGTSGAGGGGMASSNGGTPGAAGSGAGTTSTIGAAGVAGDGAVSSSGSGGVTSAGGGSAGAGASGASGVIGSAGTSTTANAKSSGGCAYVPPAGKTSPTDGWLVLGALTGVVALLARRAR